MNLKKPTLFVVALLSICTAVRAAEVSETWEKDCRKCHGSDGKGETKMGQKYGVKDYTSADVQAKLTDAGMAKAIKEGVKDADGKDRMKAYPDFTDDQVKALVAYVRAFKK
ncbi:MAG TPA: cytochrome c [Verrucomicrobiae bacterium]|nr:cytochrome c [Verrucomicrobiae bacterium]